MRYKPDHKAKVRSFILDKAGRRLRKEGFSGVGVNGLMEDAGLTTGAFYSHFSCKDELLLAVLQGGLDEIVQRLDSRMEEGAPAWIAKVFERYFAVQHCIEVENGCILPALTVDASRSGPQAKALYRAGVLRIIERLTLGLSDPHDRGARARAWTALSLMVGAVTIARALPPGAVQDELLTAALENSRLF